MDKAIDECIWEVVLVNILKKHRTLAKYSILTEYDEKKRRRLDRQEGYEDGKVDGYENGINFGMSKGIEKLVFRFPLNPAEAEEYIKDANK